MGYRMRMRLAVDVDITAADSTEAFQRLSMVKHHIRHALATSGISAADRDSVRKFAHIVDANTHAFLKEESFPDEKPTEQTPEPAPPDAIDGVLHEHLLFVLNRYRNDALFEAETMPNNRKHAVQGLTESAELTRRLIHIVEKMEIK